jgi:hypothetical protein
VLDKLYLRELSGLEWDGPQPAARASPVPPTRVCVLSACSARGA